MTEVMESKILGSRKRKLRDLERIRSHPQTSPELYLKRMGADMDTEAVRCRHCLIPLLGKVAISRSPSYGSGIRVSVTKYYCSDCAERISIF